MNLSDIESDFLGSLNTTRQAAKKHQDDTLDTHFLILAYKFGYSMGSFNGILQDAKSEILKEMVEKLSENEGAGDERKHTATSGTDAVHGPGPVEGDQPR